MKIQRSIGIIFEVLFILALSIVFLVSLTGTQYHIAWYKVLFVTCIWLVCFGVMAFLFYRLDGFFEKYGMRILPFLLCAWAVFLYIFSCVVKNQPNKDYQILYGAALDYAEGADVSWWYMAIWKNNFFLFFLLGNVAKIAKVFGAEAFYFILVFAVLMVVVSGYCIFTLIVESGGRVSHGYMGMIFLMLFLPCLGGTQYFYTDSMSICFGVLASLLFLKKHPLLAGICFGVGFCIKATVGISLVAIIITSLLGVRGIKQFKSVARYMAFVLLGFLLVQVSVEAVWRQYPCSGMNEQYGAPVEYWLAMGMVNNGSYLENSDFADECIDTPGKDAKRQVATGYMAENISEVLNPSRINRKIRYNFASGFMGLPDYQCLPVNFSYEFFNDYGKYGGYTAMLSTGYLYAIFIMGVLLGIYDFLRLLKGKETEKITLLAQLTVFGLILFLMIWEAENRQLYNHMPWFALMGGISLSRASSIFANKGNK